MKNDQNVKALLKKVADLLADGYAITVEATKTTGVYVKGDHVLRPVATQTIKMAAIN